MTSNFSSPLEPVKSVESDAPSSITALATEPVSANISSSSTSPAPSVALSFPSFLASQSPSSLSVNRPNSPTRSSIASLIAQSYSPRIAIVSSPDLEELSQFKGFCSFLSLIQPFGALIDGKITAHDTQGTSYIIEDFSVRFTSSRIYDQRSNGPTSPVSSKPRKSGVMPCFSSDDLDQLLEYYLKNDISSLSDNVSSSGSYHDLLYYKFLQKIMSSPPVSAHESFSHPVAAVIAISSKNTQPIESLSGLYRSSSEVPVPQYLNRDYLRYYILVHDEDNDDLNK